MSDDSTPAVADGRGPEIDGRGLRPPAVYVIERVEPAPQGVVLVRVQGEVDLAAAPELRALVDEAEAVRASAVVVDLTEMVFMDSSILKELLRARSVLARSGGRIVLAGAPEPAQRLLEMTRTAALFDLVADRAAGVAIVTRAT